MPILTVKNNELVSAEEAIKISTNFSDISILRVCYKISKTWEPITRDAAYDEACMLAACYTAGYIQAKREERAKVAQKKAKAEARRKNDRLEMWRDYINDLASDTDNEYALNMMYSLAIGVFRHWGRTKKKEKANANKSSIS